jgi:glycosyltransferase 2 family protein
MMKNRWVRVALIVLVMAVLLYFSFKSVNWKDAWRYMTRANLGLFLLVILLSPLHLVTRGFRWRYLLIHEKKDVKFANLFAGNAVGFAVTFIFPGRVGEIVKPLWVARKEKIRAGFALGTVIVERIFDMFTMCFLLAVFLLARPLYETTFKVQADAYTKLTNWGIVGAVIATGLLTVCLLFYFFREKAIRVTMFFLKPFPSKWSEKIRTLLHEFIDGLKFFHSLGNLATYIVLSIVVWLGITFFYWVFFQAYGVQIPYFLLIPYIFLTMVGASIPTPGMVAGFEAFSIFGLSLLYPGIFPKGDTSLAAGLTIVVHAVQLIVTCLIGYAIVWKQGLSLFQLKKLEESVEP